jgi:rRNA maturation protein Nop10
LNDDAISVVTPPRFRLKYLHEKQRRRELLDLRLRACFGIQG